MSHIVLFTNQIGKPEDIPSGTHLLDITVKSGIEQFAPTWQMVLDYKSGKLSKAAYTTLYQQMMRESQVANKALWDSLATYPKLSLQCYCQPGKFCHRLLLVDILTDYFDEQGIEVLYNPET